MPYGEITWNNAADGWVMVEKDGDIHKMLLKTADVEWGISGITGEPVAPGWVVDALKTYNDNGGFAGMSPAEYLDKVSDGKKERPKHTF